MYFTNLSRHMESMVTHKDFFLTKVTWNHSVIMTVTLAKYLSLASSVDCPLNGGTQSLKNCSIGSKNQINEKRL